MVLGFKLGIQSSGAELEDRAFCSGDINILII